MKNCIKLFGIITLAVVIGFSFLSCEDMFHQETIVETTSGELIIRGLSDFNDKNVIAYGYPSDGTYFMAGKDLTKKGDDATVTYATVKNGVVTLKVWKADAGFTKFTNFSRPAASVEFRVVCIEIRDELREKSPDADPKPSGVIGTANASFNAEGKEDNAQFVKGTPY